MVPCGVMVHSEAAAASTPAGPSHVFVLLLLLCVCQAQVEIGAFRTYPEGYKPPDEGPSEYQTIPLSKIEDFGVHAKQVSTMDAILGPA